MKKKINNSNFFDLPVELQNMLDEVQSLENDPIIVSEGLVDDFYPDRFVCKGCGSDDIIVYNHTDEGKFLYKCDHCGDILSKNELNII
jgi:predicted RNA-binding Zn-ribbon protein involved in translation (DUF1610 family)